MSSAPARSFRLQSLAGAPGMAAELRLISNEEHSKFYPMSPRFNTSVTCQMPRWHIKIT